MRKPNPGMIKFAKKKYHLNLKKSFVVGDTHKDIMAGKKANCKTILLKKIYNKNQILRPDYTIKNLKELINIIKV